jgi:hypothetical protein
LYLVRYAAPDIAATLRRTVGAAHALVFVVDEVS